MTAEFAIMLPAVLMVLVLAISAILLATHRMTLSAAAHEIARLEARGDITAAQAQLGNLGGGVEISRQQRGMLHCVTLGASPVGGLLQAATVSADGCAARTEQSQ